MGTTGTMEWSALEGSQDKTTATNKAVRLSEPQYEPIPVSADELTELRTFVTKFIEYRKQHPLDSGAK